MRLAILCDMMVARPWFSPKKTAGWGWRPASWQGWLVTVVLVAAIAVIFIELGPTVPAYVAVIACLVVYGIIIWLTGGKPGGPRAN
jgi:hypothetical protein